MRWRWRSVNGSADCAKMGAQVHGPDNRNMGRAKSAAVVVDHFATVLGTRRGARGNERLVRSLRSASRQCVAGTVLYGVIEVLREPVEDNLTVALQRQLRADLLARLQRDAMAAQSEDFRVYTHVSGVTPHTTARIRVAHDGESVLHIVDGASESNAPSAHCGLALTGDGAAPRGAWKSPATLPFAQRRCPECALASAQYPECSEGRQYPLFEAPALTRLHELAGDAIDFELESELARDLADSERLQHLAADALNGAFLRVLSEEAAALPGERVRTLIGQGNVREFTSMATNWVPVFSTLLSADDWLQVFMDIADQYPDGDTRFDTRELVAGVAAKMRANIIARNRIAV